MILNICLFIAGSALSGIIVYLLMRPMARTLAERTAQLEEQEKRASDLAARVEDLNGHLHAAEAEASRIPSLEEQIANLDRQLKERIESVAALQANLEQERKAADEKLAILDEARQKLSDAFTALASNALQQNNEAFLQLAGERLSAAERQNKSELEKRQQAVAELIAPLREQLKRYEEQIHGLETLREKAYGELHAQVAQLGESQRGLNEETRRLVHALSAPQVRGRWGEVTLRRAVELAGMVEHCDFEEQVSVGTEDGRLRPDMVVNLPEERSIVIDAKTPLVAFMDAINSADPDDRRAHMRRYADHVAGHLEKLSQKEYWNQFKTAPEFVVMFIPGEGFLAAAAEHKPDLIEKGFERKVILATPATLFALLRTVAMGWRQELLAREAQQISELGSQLYERLAVVVKHLGSVGSNLESAVKSYNQAMASIESRLLVTARKFPDLGIAVSKTLPEQVGLIEITPGAVKTDD
ncbi:DNA recombination protein RmuC [bacterium]|nr:DNA recombination protein RmuC [bacterium]